MADAGPLPHLPYLFTSLVRLAPINHLLRRLPAANAFIGQVLLLKGYASGCGSGHLLDFLLTLQAAAQAQLTHGARCVTHTVRCACVKQALDHRRSPPRQPFRRR